MMQPSSTETPSGSSLSPSDDEKTQKNITPNDKQIVLYDPTSNGSHKISPIKLKLPLKKSSSSGSSSNPRPSSGLPTVGTFTVQCAECFKWRLIPSKERYERIREHILEEPFYCELVKEWRPEISCDVDGDIEQDGSRLWAIDKPNIAQPPPGWERELRIRGEGGSKFADVYYMAPSGKRLRSMVEVQKYLLEHPEFIRQGITLSQFSFQIPKPLQENYVRKRPSRATDCPSRAADSGSETNLGTSKNLEPKEVQPISWVPLDDPSDLKLGEPAFSDSYSRDPSLDTPPTKKKARPSSDDMYGSDKLHKPHKFKIKGPRPPPHGVYDL